MYIATDISKQWCRRFLEILAVGHFHPFPTMLVGWSTVWDYCKRGRWRAMWPIMKSWLFFLRKKCQQLVYWLPMLSRALKDVVLVELLRFYKKCDHYSWQYIAVVDDEHCSPGCFEVFYLKGVVGRFYAECATRTTFSTAQPIIGTREYHKSR